MRRGWSLGGLRMLALRTYVLERNLVLAWLWYDGIDTRHYKLHLEVIGHVLPKSIKSQTYLQALYLALETLDEVLHVLTIEALLHLLLGRLRSLRLFV